jgi:hypothetical protein
MAIPDPATQAVLLELTTTTLWWPAYKDNADAPLATSAKQLPIKPHYRQLACPTYVAVFYKTTLDNAYVRQFADALNTGTWRDWLAREAWIASIDATPVDTDYGTRWKYRVQVMCKRGGWSTEVPDVGWTYLDGSNLRSFTTTDNVPHYGNLDGAGDALATSSDLVVLDYYCQHEESFSTLGF